ncbi:hypothetical protein [Lysobacter sp. CA199]|uniref:hypothetical protein n=1 Tax=Lysobacter sp. CA199 TaxID=3455608 RepID=UPI003F8D27C5
MWIDGARSPASRLNPMVCEVSRNSDGLSRSNSEKVGLDTVQRVLDPAGTTQNCPCRRTPWRSCRPTRYDTGTGAPSCRHSTWRPSTGESNKPSGTGEVSTSRSGVRSGPTLVNSAGEGSG